MAENQNHNVDSNNKELVYGRWFIRLLICPTFFIMGIVGIVSGVVNTFSGKEIYGEFKLGDAPFFIGIIDQAWLFWKYESHYKVLKALNRYVIYAGLGMVTSGIHLFINGQKDGLWLIPIGLILAAMFFIEDRQTNKTNKMPILRIKLRK